MFSIFKKKVVDDQSEMLKQVEKQKQKDEDGEHYKHILVQLPKVNQLIEQEKKRNNDEKANELRSQRREMMNEFEVLKRKLNK